ncbi:MAG TPA: class I SAM-dependent methyltransferase [Vicinamibacterales bacterium]|nr:class I SAM-dependent methyltransferase [Vicinamibacterales bacterium]
MAARTCGDESVTAGRGAGQRGWYEWASRHVAGCAVLDAGCGLGYGLPILARTAASVRGQDLDPRLRSELVDIVPLDDIPGGSFDVVLAVDVVEHVEDDRGFVAHLARIARRRVILTTPNWTASRNVWPYHVREYTPWQLRDLCAPFGACRMWKGTPDGSEVHPIRHPYWNDCLNRWRVPAPSAQAVRVLNRLLPSKSRIHSHLAIMIDRSHR